MLLQSSWNAGNAGDTGKTGTLGSLETSGALGAMLGLLGIFVSEECWNCMRQCDSRNAVTTEHSCATSNFGIEEYINPVLRKVYFEPCH